MTRLDPKSDRGTVILIALCFVAVLGLVLASYINVCSRAMNLSNRSFQADVSRQLAEAGLEEGLRAFNKNDWNSWSNGVAVTWDTSTYSSAKRAVATMTFPAGTFGQGVTATVKIRADNYDANALGSSWVANRIYNQGEIVGSSGTWYVCLVSHTSSASNQPPNLNYWAPEGVPWRYTSLRTYSYGDLVFYGSNWYRYTSASPGSSAPPASSWTLVPSLNPGWPYPNNSIQYDGWTWQIYTSGNWNTAQISWQWDSASKQYSFNDVVYYGGAWYRCISSHYSSNTWTYTPSNTSSIYWQSITSIWAWNALYAYEIGAVVYHSGTSRWYRCVRANTNQTPSTTSSYWADTPSLSQMWSSGIRYVANDVVSYKGVWYLCIQTHTSSTSILPTSASYWVGTDTSNSSYIWSAATNYLVGAFVCYGDVWYNCTATGNTGKTPNDSGYWTAAWSQSNGVTTGAPVLYAEATVTLGDGTTSRTQLRSPLGVAPLFPNAVAATSTIVTSNGGTVDSYDSGTGTVAVQNGVANTTTPNINNGTYASHVGTATNYSAVVAAGSSMTLSSPTVKGYVAWPSPPAGIGGSVKGFTSSASPAIDPARISRSPYIPRFDTLPAGPGGLAANWSTTPKGTALPTSGTPINLGTPGATTPSRYYYNGNYTIGNGSITNVRIHGPVILYINGNLFITASGSTGRMDIASTGSAQIHVTGAFKVDSNGEGIPNYTSDPKSLIIICDTTSTTRHFYSEGVNDFYGVIYAPYGTGTGDYFNDNNNTEIFGAVLARNITYSGANTNVHYDTALRYATFGGVDQPYAVTEYRELPATEAATMP